MRIRSGALAAEVDPLDGGRIISCTWQNLQLVESRREHLTSWGWFAMAPWAGRVAYGSLKTPNGNIQLPTDLLPPHSIHGYAIRQPWTVKSVDQSHIVMTSPTPAPYTDGEMIQEIEVGDHTLHWSITYRGGVPMPAWVGLHPWFRRQLSRGAPAILEFQARKMLRTVDGLPTGDVIDPVSGPYDDAFTGLTGAPAIRWPGALRIQIETIAPWWVIYDKDPAAVCIEPQSAPPDAASLNVSPVIGPGESTSVAAVFRFTPE